MPTSELFREESKDWIADALIAATRMMAVAVVSRGRQCLEAATGGRGDVGRIEEDSDIDDVETGSEDGIDEQTRRGGVSDCGDGRRGRETTGERHEGHGLETRWGWLNGRKSSVWEAAVPRRAKELWSLSMVTSGEESGQASTSLQSVVGGVGAGERRDVAVVEAGCGEG